MKKGTSSLLALFIVQSFLWWSVSSASCGISKNPLLKQLEKHYVKILKGSPKIEDQNCRDEWREHGTCCETESLKAYFLNDKKTLEQSFHDVENILKNKFVKLIESCVFHTSKIIHEKRYVPSFLEKAVGFIYNKREKLSRNKLDELSQSLSLGMDQCVDKMVKIRGGALCKICSGRSENAFLSGKPLMSNDLCIEINSKCYHQLTAMIDFMSLIDETVIPLSKVDIKTIPDQRMKDLITKISKLGIVKGGESLNTLGILLEGHSKSAQIGFCERVTTIVGDPFFVSLPNELKIIYEALSQLEILIKMFSENSMGIWTIMSRGFSTRRLQIMPFSFNLFTPDIIVVPENLILNVDSSYTSYQGALGTKGNEASNLYKILPINTTDLFP